MTAHIDKIVISQLRNLNAVKLNLGLINIFIGHNGSGKTSMVESLFLLSRGKSFRHHQPKHYINHTAEQCVVWAQLSDKTTLAIAKTTNANTSLRHNDNIIKSQSEMTKKLPLVVIDPSGMDVLEDGAATRRQMLDWLSFHLNAEFYEQWLTYQRLLKQRNSLLKSSNHDHRHFLQLTAWDKQLSAAGERLHLYRQAAYEAWQSCFHEACALLLPHYAEDLSFDYQAGFDTSDGLANVLQARLAQDCELGYTRIGAHRADISLTLKANGRHQAINVLSRGEKKLLIAALKLSKLKTLIAHAAHDDSALPIVLIDDIDSELDKKAAALLMTTLSQMSCQLFVTSLNDELLSFLPSCGDVCVFDVQNGVIAPAAYSQIPN